MFGPPQLIRKYGYEVEEHEVRTEDGYLLAMYRIPPRHLGSRRYPIFLMHSLLSTSADWVLIGRNHGLAYLLADLGYDVWMGNARGNRYSRKHERYAITSVEFWDFTWHEIGLYDVPAFIDYVLKQTDSRKLHFIGYSQGTIVVFVALSERPELNEKLVQMQLLSPAIYLKEFDSFLLKLIVMSCDEIVARLTASQIYEFTPYFEYQYFFFKRLCPSPAQRVCRLVIFDVVGGYPENLDVKLLRILLGHFPAGVSVKQIHHVCQLFRDGIFQQYDYGNPEINLQRYGSTQVPKYNVSRVKAPVRFYYSYGDRVVNYRNVLQLQQELSNLVSSYPVPDKLFGHADFAYGRDVKEVLYEEVLTNLEQADGAESFISLEILVPW
ncbi:lipase 1-like [Malaya genurostris]|uniref:lipase 1-like n=1 Tax=Malaya genurostris TaxID=325434 RepID=UPI0026F40308|nr:lipase 1-like [Malaya genurostris]